MSPTPNSSPRARKSTKAQAPSVPEPPVSPPPEATPSPLAPKSPPSPGELKRPESRGLVITESSGRRSTATPPPERPAAPPPRPPQSYTISEPPKKEDEPLPSGVLRNYPISPPSEPRQYRAIGLVKGRYLPCPDQFTKGILQRSDGVNIDAVLLGRVMSLVKNHLNLEEEHLWVVYPRTRQEDGNLHTQIMGVWEPETLTRSEENSDPSTANQPIPNTSVEDGYFSIRGEVIYQSPGEENPYVIVKIKQSPRKEGDKIKFFKLKIEGLLPEKAIGFFWDFQAYLQADILLIQQANNMGAMPIKKKKPFPPGSDKGKRSFSPKRDSESGGYRAFKKPDPTSQSFRKDVSPKPIKRSKPIEPS